MNSTVPKQPVPDVLCHILALYRTLETQYVYCRCPIGTGCSNCGDGSESSFCVRMSNLMVGYLADYRVNTTDEILPRSSVRVLLERMIFWSLYLQVVIHYAVHPYMPLQTLLIPVDFVELINSSQYLLKRVQPSVQVFVQFFLSRRFPTLFVFF